MSHDPIVGARVGPPTSTTSHTGGRSTPRKNNLSQPTSPAPGDSSQRRQRPGQLSDRRRAANVRAAGTARPRASVPDQPLELTAQPADGMTRGGPDRSASSGARERPDLGAGAQRSADGGTRPQGRRRPCPAASVDASVAASAGCLRGQASLRGQACARGQASAREPACRRRPSRRRKPGRPARRGRRGGFGARRAGPAGRPGRRHRRPRRNPTAATSQSITRPASGAPRATPTVRAELCRPIASPRAAAGVIRLTASAVAVMVGAHRAPAGSRSRASSHQCSPPSPTGMVSSAIGANSVSGVRPRFDRAVGEAAQQGDTPPRCRAPRRSTRPRRCRAAPRPPPRRCR